MNESVWLDHKAAGAALPGRKVMSLVHGMLAGADSIDDMNVLRAGSTGSDPRASGDGALHARDVLAGVHVRACPPARPRPGHHARAGVGGGCRSRRRAVGDRHRQLHRRGPRRSEAGRLLRLHPPARLSPDRSRFVPTPARCCTSATARARPTRSAAPAGSWMSCSRRVRRAGHTGTIVIRADSGFENHKQFTTLDRQGVEFSIGVKQSKTIRALIDEIPETTGSRRRLPRSRRGADRRDPTRELAADRPSHPPQRSAGRVVPRLAPPRIRDQPHRPDARGRYRSSRPRDDRARDPRPQRPSPRALPLRPVRGKQRVDGDRRARAQPRTLDNPDRSPRPARPDRPLPPPSPAPDPRPPDPHQPPMDTPDARPLAMAEPTSPPSSTESARSPPSPDHPRQSRGPARPAAGPRHRSPLPENPTETFPRERRHPTSHPNPTRSPQTPTETPRSRSIHPIRPAARWIQA